MLHPKKTHLKITHGAREDNREREEQGREREEESNRDGRERRLQENYFKDDWYPGDWLLKKLRMPLLDVMVTF